MFGLGMSEIIFLAVLALIVIGPKELPQLARTLGRFLNELKRSTDSLTDELKTQARIDKIDLFEAPKKAPPKAVVQNHPDTTNPEQLELTEQQPPVSDSKENKPS
ncbi:MAG: twin-arginine translocase TatA/TatE family subunit [Bdellovibrio sp.]|nr:twin-arginine translocase TatA/TatE family subunit [Bdellovibrio sp.]